MPQKQIYVFDTNVILNDPYAIFSYDDALIIVPQTVLTELDKLKLSRSDREVKFRGREFSRVLFELSEFGSLTDGIELDNDAIIKVIPFDPSKEIPETLNSKNSDDRILGSAWLLRQEYPDKEVTLISNDLNMLIKAQTLGIKVEQHEYKEKSPLRRFINQLSGRRVTMLWLLVPLVLLSLLLVLWLFNFSSPLPANRQVISPISDPFQTFSTQELSLINQLKKDRDNEQLWMQLGRVQLDWADSYQQENRVSEARIKYQDSLASFQRVVELNPENLKARNNLASIYFVLGNTELSISEYVRIIELDPKFSDAYFNLGVVLWRHRDLKGALRAFETYLEVAPEGERAQEAKKAIEELKAGIESQST